MAHVRIDFHVHTRASPDALDAPEVMVSAARERGLDGIAITDHDRRGGYDRLVRLGLADPSGCAVDGFLVIPGVEVSCIEGHVLVLGAAWDAGPGWSAARVVRRAHAEGAIAVAAHPYDRLRSGVGHEVMRTVAFDAVEGCNSKTVEAASNSAACRFARGHHQPVIAGSDAHFAATVGRAHAVVETPELSVEAVLESVLAHRTQIVPGRHTAGEMLRYWARGWFTRPWVLDMTVRGAARVTRRAPADRQAAPAA
ncbi:MAG: PHP domain-containing protein [Phycisphaerales bacterium]|nr:PHP domain-containing protein [Phycisphaerales bacterium]